MVGTRYNVGSSQGDNLDVLVATTQVASSISSFEKDRN